MAFWPKIHKDFNMWINDFAVCHQQRTVGVLAPMKSTLASIDEFAKTVYAERLGELLYGKLPVYIPGSVQGGAIHET
eukprot:9025065-Karenia_brevis.AAC.1